MQKIPDIIPHLLLPPLLALTSTLIGCAPITPSTAKEAIHSESTIQPPRNFRDARPEAERKTSISNTKSSTTISYGDDISPSAFATLIHQINQEYPDNLATHKITINKIELTGIFRSETPPYHLASSLSPSSAALAFGASALIQEKSIFINIIGDVDGKEFSGWAHETCKLCSVQNTLDKIITNGVNKATESIRQALQNTPPKK